jgi:signal transduction histidine kinase/ActR/RegA family two-component response regulator
VGDRLTAAEVLDVLERIPSADTPDGMADLLCASVVAFGRFRRAAYVAAFRGGLVFGSAGLGEDERASLRKSMALFGPVERSLNRLHVLERHRLVPGLDVAFVPCESGRADLPPSLLGGPAGHAPPGRRWEPQDELVLLPHDEKGASLGTLALADPADGRRPSAVDATLLADLLRLTGTAARSIRGRQRAIDAGRDEARRVLGYVESLTQISDLEVLLDHTARICATLAGFRVGVLTAHVEDGPRLGAWNLKPEERAAFARTQRGSTLEGTAAKRAKIRALAFPGTGIAYVPKTVDLARSRAFTPSPEPARGTWDAEDRLFILLKTTRGQDFGVLSLDEPLDGDAPRVHMLGPLKVAERFLDLAGAILEARLLSAHVERVQRLEAVGTLAAGIAHDFNNLLGGIMGYASLLRLKAPEGSDLATIAKAVEDACERAAGLTKRLRGLTSSALPASGPVDVRAVIEDCAKVARETFDRRIEVQVALPGALPSVRGDAGQLYQAVLNLCINARDAVGGGGWIRLSAESDATPGVLASQRPRRWVRIEVADNGRGIDDAVKPRLFEPFITTKSREKGPGLGLFHSWSVARAHGGTIEAADRPGGGSVFRILLPAEEPAPAETPRQAPASAAAARILVVEDEPMLQDLLRRGLEAMGHRVRIAGDGDEAVAAVEDASEEYDLVVLDLILPKRSGTEVFQVIQDRRPGLPVLLSSGNVEEGLLDSDLMRGVAGVLPKPWRITDLDQAVSRILSPDRAE